MRKKSHSILDPKRFIEPPSRVGVRGLPNSFPGHNNPTPLARKVVIFVAFFFFPIIIGTLIVLLFDFIQIF